MLHVVDCSDLSVVSDLQERESWIDISCRDELDNVRLALSRQLGVPEPELYQDEPDNTWKDKEDWEAIERDMVNLQERMSRGMKMIQDCKEVLHKAKTVKRIPYEDFVSWRAREKKLWNHWWNLKAQCDELIGENNWLWNRYFSLSETMIDRNGYTNDETECPEWLIDFDQLAALYANSEDSVEE